MPHPLTWIACSWASGIALAAVWMPSPVAPLLVGVAALGAGCAAPALRPFVIPLAAVAGGALALTLQLDARSALRGRVELTLEGSVSRRLSGGVLLGGIRGPRDLALPQRILLRDGYAGSGETSLEGLEEGRRIRARARLRPPQRLRNPGAPLAARAPSGLGGVGQPTHPDLWVARTTTRAPAARLHALRDRVATRLAAEGPGGALLAALSVGRREALDAELRDAIARIGLGHLLAVSGLHLVLVAGGCYALTRRVLARSAQLAARTDTRRLAGGVAWLLASAYALLSGGAAPVQRAWVCLSLPWLALWIGRSGRLRGALAGAALLLLVRDPVALFSAGAQLSFAAAVALGLEVARAQRDGAAGSLVRASATAMLATAPLAALHFAPVAPVGLLVNLIAVPWTACVLLPLALLCAALVAAGATFPGMAQLLSGAAGLAGFSLVAISQFDAWLGPRLRPPPSGVAIALAALVALGVLRIPSTRSRILGCLAVTGWLTLAPPAALGPTPPRVIVLDVGQGDAILVQGRRAAILVDAGIARPDGLDRGRDVVVPALRALGITRLDLVVVTHADLDHRGGVPAVVADFPVERLWLPPGALRDPAFASILEAARTRAAAVAERGAGAAPERFGDLTVRPLWPPVSDAHGRSTSENDRSLVLQIAVAGRRVLLPGDLEAAGEAALLRATDDLQSEVLLLGHHGSRTSSSESFLAAVAPQVALVSAPCLGRFSMPHPGVVARLAARGVPLAWTGRDGALRLGLEGALVVRGTGKRRAYCMTDRDERRVAPPPSDRSAGCRARTRPAPRTRGRAGPLRPRDRESRRRHTARAETG